MADGRTHRRVSLALAGPAAVAVALWTHDPLAGLSVAVGCVLSIPLTPDLDQEGISSFEWELVRRTFGLGFLWLAFWWPYAKSFEHRRVWSHLPVLGTVIRVIYLLLLPATLVFSFWRPSILFLWFVLWGFVGLVVGDVAHWVLDGFPVRFR